MSAFRLFVLTALCGIIALSAAEPTSPADPIARVESGLLPPARLAGTTAAPWSLASRLAHYRVPGVSVAVIADGKIAWARGYGVARAGEAAPVTPVTLFQAASLSKPVAAAAALTLVDAGKLTLDADVNDKLTSWKIPAAPVAADQPVTLRRLLSHTAGLTVHDFAGYGSEAPRPTLLQILDGLPPANSAALRVTLRPGTIWQYSSGGYCVAQQLLLDVTGESFSAFLQQRVLGPAGMTASTFEQPLPAALAPQAAAGHLPNGERLPGDAHVYPEQAAAGLWTTPTDLARFALALRAALDGQSSLLTRATATAMITPPLPGSDYGLGLGVSGADEKLQLAHSGSHAGFRGSLVFYPRTGRGAIVLTNSDNGGPLISEILRALAREYDWPDYRVVEKTAIPLSSSAVSSFSGRYERENTPVLVFRLDDHFYLRIGDRPRLELFPQSDHEFFTLDSPDLWSFERSPLGVVTHLILRSSPPQLYRRLNVAPAPFRVAPSSTPPAEPKPKPKITTEMLRP